MTTKFQKLSEEESLDILNSYISSPTKDTIAYLVEKYGRSVRSIVAKLAKAGVYVRPNYVDKNGEAPCTKEDLVRNLEQECGVKDLEFEGLEKAPKMVLKKLISIVKEAKAYD